MKTLPPAVSGKNYCEAYDAYFDNTGKWLEKKCKSKNCEYCGERPNKHKSHYFIGMDGKKYRCGK